MLGSLLKKFFGDKNVKAAQELWPIVEQINFEWEKLKELTDDELRGKTKEFKERIYESTKDIQVPLNEFKATTGAILRDLRSSTKAPGQTRIYTAGEKEFEHEKLVRVKGVPVNSNLQNDIKTMQAGLKLDRYKFPF